MAVDIWTSQIFESFVSVLRRPRYNMKVSEITDFDNPNSLYAGSVYTKGLYVYITTSWGETLKINITSDKWQARITCFDDTGSDAIFTGEKRGFHYFVKIPRNMPIRIRKTALIFINKLSQKPVYDCLMT